MELKLASVVNSAFVVLVPLINYHDCKFVILGASEMVTKGHLSEETCWNHRFCFSCVVLNKVSKTGMFLFLYFHSCVFEDFIYTPYFFDELFEVITLKWYVLCQ